MVIGAAKCAVEVTCGAEVTCGPAVTFRLTCNHSSEGRLLRSDKPFDKDWLGYNPAVIFSSENYAVYRRNSVG